MARVTISYISLVAHSFLSIAGVGNQGISTVAGVVPVSSLSYNVLSLETRAASSEISEQDKLRTVVWKMSYHGFSSVTEAENKSKEILRCRYSRMDQTIQKIPRFPSTFENPPGLRE